MYLLEVINILMNMFNVLYNDGYRHLLIIIINISQQGRYPHKPAWLSPSSHHLLIINFKPFFDYLKC